MAFVTWLHEAKLFAVLILAEWTVFFFCAHDSPDSDWLEFLHEKRYLAGANLNLLRASFELDFAIRMTPNRLSCCGTACAGFALLKVLRCWWCWFGFWQQFLFGHRGCNFDSSVCSAVWWYLLHLPQKLNSCTRDYYSCAPGLVFKRFVAAIHASRLCSANFVSESDCSHFVCRNFGDLSSFAFR